MNADASAGDRQTRHSSAPEHDQDSDAPRTAVPPGGPKPGEAPNSDQPGHDQDSDPPRTAVPPKP
jgi:hypothetical protein